MNCSSMSNLSPFFGFLIFFARISESASHRVLGLTLLFKNYRCLYFLPALTARTKESLKHFHLLTISHAAKEKREMLDAFYFFSSVVHTYID